MPAGQLSVLFQCYKRKIQTLFFRLAVFYQSYFKLPHSALVVSSTSHSKDMKHPLPSPPALPLPRLYYQFVKAAYRFYVPPPSGPPAPPLSNLSSQPSNDLNSMLFRRARPPCRYLHPSPHHSPRSSSSSNTEPHPTSRSALASTPPPGPAKPAVVTVCQQPEGRRYLSRTYISSKVPCFGLQVRSLSYGKGSSSG
jgi:hypothetical protein